MLGHIVIGLDMVSKHCAQIQGFPNDAESGETERAFRRNGAPIPNQTA
jgi:hypothetical protein